MELAEIQDLTKEFLIKKIESDKKITTGNINATICMTAEDGTRYILQRINKEVFKRPKEVMQNIRRVNRYLERQVLQEGGDPSREVLHPVSTIDGSCYTVDSNGDYWRVYDFIEGAKTYDTLEDAEKDGQDPIETFRKVGQAFGKFQNRLSDYPVETLHTAIPDFHNTARRFADFEVAIGTDKMGRLAEVKDNPNHPLNKAIEYIREHEDELRLIEEGKASGKIPLRVTHNDTKINNVMIDKKTGEAICVIDLDTVGPDSALVDYGDAIRSGCNRQGEMPKDIKAVSMDMDLFKAYTEGNLSEMKLTKEELELLHKAPKILTLELAMRFLGDYLNGDTYFGIPDGKPEDINLTRGLVQTILAKDMEQKEPEMQKIIEEIIGRTDESQGEPRTQIEDQDENPGIEPGDN